VILPANNFGKPLPRPRTDIDFSFEAFDWGGD